eukprot:9620062-Alexandrium_andersonii.AAC.1
MLILQVLLSPTPEFRPTVPPLAVLTARPLPRRRRCGPSPLPRRRRRHRVQHCPARSRAPRRGARAQPR